MDNKPEEQQLIVQAQQALAMQPDVVINQARQAAQALKSIIDQKAKKVMINGEQYLEFEDWQTLGRFYGYTAAATETTEVWRDNQLLGFTAKAVVYQNGQVVSNAEASCMRDEPNWKTRPEFMLKSMAQTRACAKALRNVLAWVAVLAGYKPTPAEEMDGVVPAKGNDQPAAQQQEERKATAKQIEYIEKSFRWKKINKTAFEQAGKPLADLSLTEAKKLLELLFDKEREVAITELLRVVGAPSDQRLVGGAEDSE